MKKKLLVVVASENFQDIEYQGLVDELTPDKIEYKITSTESQAKGVYGKVLDVDILVKDINAEEFDGIAIIGGGGALSFLGDKDLYKALEKFYQLGKLVSAICISPVILASVGILKDKKATVFPTGINNIKAKGAIYVEEDVVVDNNVITSNGPSAAHDFGKAVGEWLLC